MRLMIGATLLLLTAAATPTSLRPGLWQIASTPGTASLDGRPLGDLPYTPPTGVDTICLTPAAARDPARWLARDAAAGCILSRRSAAGGRVDMAGTCPPQAAGLTPGTVRITGRWTPTSYALRFATQNPSENGRMGFTGTLTGKRIGDCRRQASTAITVSPR